VWNATTLEELRTVKTVQGGSIYALAVVEVTRAEAHVLCRRVAER
jgi:hypothetical protein